jgi:hypothetical protein
MRSVFEVKLEQAELEKAFHFAPDVIFIHCFKQHGINIPILHACIQKYPSISQGSELQSISSTNGARRPDGH